jgi:hypothetical protein
MNTNEHEYGGKANAWGECHVRQTAYLVTLPASDVSELKWLQSQS